MPNFKLEFDWDLSEDEQNLVSIVMMQVEPQAAAAVAEEREACILDVCAFCNPHARKMYGPAFWHKERERWVHRDLRWDEFVLCEAGRIRARASGGDGGD